MSFMKEKIVFFDGHCNLCNFSVDLLIRLDYKNILLFAPLSGKAAKDVGIKQSNDEAQQSVVYFRNPSEIFDKIKCCD